MRGYEELRTMPAPDLWEEICRRLDDEAAARRPLGTGRTRVMVAQGTDASGSPAALPRGTRGRGGALDGPAWPRLVAPLAAAAAVLALAVAVAIVTRSHGRQEPGNGPRVLFPGGGRVLFADARGLKWLYPDGRTMRVARGFTGARLAAGGTQLLAWRPTQNKLARPPCAGCFADVDYYLMNLDGTARRLVLGAEPTRGNVQPAHLDVQASPDGTQLAYIRQGESVSTGSTVFDELWTVSLVTGRKTDLGPAPSSDTAVTWVNDHALVAESANGTALRLVNAGTGQTTVYLTISDRRIIRAYENARPGAGPPTAIDPLGWSTGSGPPVLAVRLWGVSRRHPSKAAVALLERDRILGLAPDRNPQIDLTWGPDGIFLLHTGLGDNPCCSATFAGTTAAALAYRQQTYFGEPWDAAALNPAGDVIALNYGYGNGATAFIPLAPPACHRAQRCLRFRPKAPLPNLGSLQAWAPQPAVPGSSAPG